MGVFGASGRVAGVLEPASAPSAAWVPVETAGPLAGSGALLGDQPPMPDALKLPVPAPKPPLLTPAFAAVTLLAVAPPVIPAPGGSTSPAEVTRMLVAAEAAWAPPPAPMPIPPAIIGGIIMPKVL